MLTKGAEALSRYLQRKKLSISAFTHLHGLNRVHVQRVLSGRSGRKVTVDFAYAIEKATGGTVRWDLWLSKGVKAGVRASGVRAAAA